MYSLLVEISFTANVLPSFVFFKNNLFRLAGIHSKITCRFSFILFILGKIWKRWFPQFITGNPREVWARSSEAYRCAETCSSLLHAMYSSRYASVLMVIRHQNILDLWCNRLFFHKEFDSIFRFKYQPISIIVPPPNQDKYTASNSLSDEELFACMEDNVDVEVVTKDGKSISSRDLLDFVKIQLDLEKDTNNYDMFVYLDGNWE